MTNLLPALTELSRHQNVRDLIEAHGGASYQAGLYRIVAAADVPSWQQRLAHAFPKILQSTCFAYDWLGRAFTCHEEGKGSVTMLEPGTGEALDIGVDLVAFHEIELPSHHDAALASSFHASWIASSGGVPKLTQCVGYKKPLFLGGADELSNLEMSDVNVYWHVMSSLLVKMR